MVTIQVADDRTFSAIIGFITRRKGGQITVEDYSKRRITIPDTFVDKLSRSSYHGNFEVIDQGQA